jgi:hypothetical protein
MPFKVLYLAFVLFGGCQRFECAQITAFAGFWIFLYRVQTIPSRFQFSYHLFFNSATCAWFSNMALISLPLTLNVILQLTKPGMLFVA